MLKIYRFHSLDDVNLESDKGAAIVLIGKERWERILLINNSNIVRTIHLEQKTDSLYPYLKIDPRIQGPLDTANNPNLTRVVKDISTNYKFPYTPAVIYLSRNGKSINIKTFSHPKDNIYPALKNYKSCDNLLQFLHQLQNIPYIPAYIEFYQDGGIPVGLGMEKGRAHWIGIDKMIEIVLQAQHSIYNFMFDKIKTISSRFPESPLTPKKAKILEDFKKYCIENAENGTNRNQLVEDWHRDYLQHNKENPFETLRLPRRTYQGLMSIFNPGKTDSIILFENYLKNECISDYLKEFMYVDSTTVPTEASKLLS